jgi:hypothetical protein
MNYIIITPAYNEQKYITQTIDSVLAQTILPKLWIIVDDGSTDRTKDIIRQYAEKYSWINYVYKPKEVGQSYYGSNVYAILEGLKHVSEAGYDYLAVLDADIELCPEYYEKIFEKFDKYLELGIATGTYIEKEGKMWVEARIDRRSTPKAIQVFRQECYKQCGGYIPFKYGGEDSGMEIMARMYGWQTWSFPEIKVIHNRAVGTGEGCSILRARFKLGLTDYCLGTHPLFMFAKGVKRAVWEKPYVVSGILRFLGYCNGYIKNEPRQLSIEARRFLRKEQMGRLLGLFRQTPWYPKE